MRLSWLGVGVAMAGLVGACSGASGPEVLGEPDAEPIADASQDSPAVRESGGDGPIADASDGAVDACSPPAVSSDEPGDRCDVVGACPTCAGTTRYRCERVTKRVQPGSRLTAVPTRIGDCRMLSDDGSIAEFCCASACVFSRTYQGPQADPGCSPTEPVRARCPANADGTSTVQLPPTCRYGGESPKPGTPAATICCML